MCPSGENGKKEFLQPKIGLTRKTLECMWFRFSGLLSLSAIIWIALTVITRIKNTQHFISPCLVSKKIERRGAEARGGPVPSQPMHGARLFVLNDFRYRSNIIIELDLTLCCPLSNLFYKAHLTLQQRFGSFHVWNSGIQTNKKLI